MANSYNPNIVAPPEMKLLELSIWEDGYTMPCVCYYDAEHDRYELVDGYHRYMVLKTSKRIYAREQGLLPVAVIDKELSNRIASTIRHNRARGTHNLELMSRNRRRADQSQHVRPLDHAAHRHGRRRAVAPQADHGTGGALRRGALQPGRRGRQRGGGNRRGTPRDRASQPRESDVSLDALPYEYEEESLRRPVLQPEHDIRKVATHREKQRSLFEEEVLA